MKKMSDIEIKAEADRLLVLLAWHASQDGIDHGHDKGFADPAAVSKSIIVHLADDLQERGYSITRIFADILMRVWAQSDDGDRKLMEQHLMANGLSAFMDNALKLPYR